MIGDGTMSISPASAPFSQHFLATALYWKDLQAAAARQRVAQSSSELVYAATSRSAVLAVLCSRGSA